MNAVIGARPRFIAPGCVEELDGFEPLPERIAARRALELTISLNDDGGLVWLGDPVHAILTAYGFRNPSNVPDFPLSTGPTRWMASAAWSVDNPILMDGSPDREVEPLDRALMVARRLRNLAGVDFVRVVHSQGARAALLRKNLLNVGYAGVRPVKTPAVVVRTNTEDFSYNSTAARPSLSSSTSH